MKNKYIVRLQNLLLLQSWFYTNFVNSLLMSVQTSHLSTHTQCVYQTLVLADYGRNNCSLCGSSPAPATVAPDSVCISEINFPPQAWAVKAEVNHRRGLARLTVPL